jgi:hypothetical protein
MPKSEAEIAQLFASNPPLPKDNPSIIKAAQRTGMVASRDSDNAMGLPGSPVNESALASMMAHHGFGQYAAALVSERFNLLSVRTDQ